MNAISVAELRQNPTEALARAEAGETVIITRHRHPIAKIVPLDAPGVALIPARKRGRANLDELLGPPRRTHDEVEALLAEMKEDR
ncbi:MAG: type II toxin-antitoxin system prevent-host-death family antitoxin [Micropruina sp.]|uniref:type II toxin-antitoxin system Phd/YefM family antitoxin n=1 Tax=Micropruina sp. TaxID=2737536 RepID=UPI0039E71B76